MKLSLTFRVTNGKDKYYYLKMQAGIVDMQPNVLGICVRAGWRDEVLSTRGERCAGDKTSNLQVTPPDAKPVLGVRFSFIV
ncbi:MAG: hypothetical protein PHC38_11730 [Weeksellaceae bacterium]|nr:hypothetical protein [Weeksellaceae bacterium]